MTKQDLMKDINNKIQQIIQKSKSQNNEISYTQIYGILNNDDDDSAIQMVEEVLKKNKIKILDENECAEEEDVAEDTSLKNDDPVRLYLKEMGAIKLLSKTEEVEIAKNMEEGSKIILSCISQLPYAMIIFDEWKEKLIDGKMTLRQVASIENIIASDESILEDEDFDFENSSIQEIESQLLPDIVDGFKLISDHYQKIAKCTKSIISASQTRKVKLGREKQESMDKIIETINSMHLHLSKINAVLLSIYKENNSILKMSVKYFKQQKSMI